MVSRLSHIALWLIFLVSAVCAAPEYQLFVDGVLYRAPAVLEKGLPYFPVDVLSRATGVSVVSFSDTAVRLAGSPVDFVPIVRNGRPYLPAEAFALATGSQVETDPVRGLVLYHKAVAASTSRPSASTNPTGQSSRTGDTAASGATQADRAQPGLQAGEEAAPEAPVSPAKLPSSANTQGIQEAVVGALKTAEEATYAERYMRHKLYWASKLDPANDPYFTNPIVPPSVVVPAAPWIIPIP